ncbi:helix-turn-helix domain-containing protein [Mycobacterium intracellulare]|uniref:Helix-turn-helix domain-containing protein n=1 Tax=Mycobacterium intracellulare TaxID=1767 RepID=A0A7R7RNT7_MYCIT|nr:helix-turn-helix domain-containing protein [Mycobacterium intracellulare]BCP00700.1 hypothetical protein MINTM018_34690 [Mycobacterium intracellulare]
MVAPDISYGEYISVSVGAAVTMIEVITVVEKLLGRQNGQLLPANLRDMREELGECVARAAANAGVSTKAVSAESVLAFSRSPAAAAKALGIKAASVRWACRNGKLGTRVGDRWLITDDEIEHYRRTHLRSGD